MRLGPGSPPRGLRVAAVRARSALGVAGGLGGVLWLVALVWAGVIWQAHRLPLNTPPISERGPAIPTTEHKEVAPAPSLELVRMDEIPLLLTLIQRTVVSQGLAWASADYKSLAATASSLPVLEVRCRLKGPYPQLRRAGVALLRDVPGLAWRELVLSRGSVDSPEVEAQLTLAVLMRLPESVVATQALSVRGQP